MLNWHRFGSVVVINLAKLHHITPHPETNAIINQIEFDGVYDKYSAPLYGLLMKLSGNDHKMAGQLLKEVFVECFRKENTNTVTSSYSYTALLRIIIKVAGAHGYPSATVTRLLLSSVILGLCDVLSTSTAG